MRDESPKTFQTRCKRGWERQQAARRSPAGCSGCTTPFKAQLCFFFCFNLNKTLREKGRQAGALVKSTPRWEQEARQNRDLSTFPEKVVVGGGVYSVALRPTSGPSGQTDRNWLGRLSFQSCHGCCDSTCQSPRTGISAGGPLKMRSGSLVSFKTHFASAQRGGGVSMSFGEYVLHTSKHAFSLVSCAATFCFSVANQSTGAAARASLMSLMMRTDIWPTADAAPSLHPLLHS